MENPTVYSINQLADSLVELEQVSVRVQGRVHHVRKNNKIAFILLRDGLKMVQVVVFKKHHPEAFESLSECPRESVIQVIGLLKPSPFVIESTGDAHEIEAFELKLVSGPVGEAPIQVEDLFAVGHDRDERKGRPDVSLVHRLNNRFLDLRSPANQALFRVRTCMETAIREFLVKRNFVEIHTPKLTACPSESGADVFGVGYFDETAYLTQSPQLYKQMMINSDFQRVFEIGAVYRAERSFGHRHLCEFMGLDLEMELRPGAAGKYDYHQVFEAVECMFSWMVTRVERECATELKVLAQYYPGDRPKLNTRIPVIEFAQAREWLRNDGFMLEKNQDLNHAAEKRLGELVAERLGADLFFLDRYPSAVRPFYTQLVEGNSVVSKSYDLILRGQEIASGAQRVNDYGMLLERIREAGLTEKNYSDYLNSFAQGSPPHAGIGIGLERLVAGYLNVPDVHLTSLLPRDPERLRP